MPQLIDNGNALSIGPSYGDYTTYPTTASLSFGTTTGTMLSVNDVSIVYETQAHHFINASAGIIQATRGGELSHHVHNEVEVKPYHKEDQLIIELPDGQIIQAKSVKMMSSSRKLHQLKEKMKRNSIPDFGRSRFTPKIIKSTALNELKAQETLREFISEKEWRRYVTNGFIMVQGHKSGLWFQIFRDDRIAVWDKGQKVCSLCIHTSAVCPPTDHVINMKTLAELDEDQLWAGANAHGVLPEFQSKLPKRSRVSPAIAIDNQGRLELFSAVNDTLFALAG